VNPEPLAGRRALITGASRGIGRAIAESLALAGADVVLVARGIAGLTAVSKTIGERAEVRACDVTDHGAVAALADALMTAGRTPDILVNNAGLFPLAPLDEMDPVEFEATMRVNVLAPFFALRALLPSFKTRRSATCLRSARWLIEQYLPAAGVRGQQVCAAGHAGSVLRQELKGTGVRSTLVSPAANTPIWDPIDPDHRPGFPTRVSMLRPADVAEAVLWAVTRPAHVNVDEVRLSSS
jgi:NADP-dependent 3-hydroxy acid dehydrogenase YdfG